MVVVDYVVTGDTKDAIHGELVRYWPESRIGYLFYMSNMIHDFVMVAMFRFCVVSNVL